MNETRFKGHELPIIRIMQWHDNELNLDFYDLWINDIFNCRCSDKNDLLSHLDIIITGEGSHV